MKVSGVTALTILFLLALLLALPTAGLSIVAFLALLGVRAYLRAKANMHHSNKRNAERSMNSAEFRLPSWANDKEKALIFLETIQQLAMRQGVPRRFLQGLLSDLDVANGIFLFAGAMEKEGASFFEQQEACAEKLVGTWSRTSETGRNEAIEKGNNAIFGDDIPF